MYVAREKNRAPHEEVLSFDKRDSTMALNGSGVQEVRNILLLLSVRIFCITQCLFLRHEIYGSTSFKLL